MTARPSIPYWKTSFDNGEAEAIVRTLKDGHISQGPEIQTFEEALGRYLGVPYIVTTTSGSMALLMSLWASKIGPGDEVIVPNRTWIATAHAALLLGATVKFIDVEVDRPIIDINKIESAISSKTKAILPVHLGGRAANMREINKIAKNNNLIVIEDAAQALGSRNIDGFLGTQSDLGCFSLSVAKIISTGQGGFIATKSYDLYQKLISMRTHGVTDVVNANWSCPGFNFRFPGLLASVGLVQLALLEGRINKAKEIYSLYKEKLANCNFLQMIEVNIEAGEVPVYFEAICEQRNEFIEYMANNSIQCRPAAPNLSEAEYFNNTTIYPASNKFAEKSFYLPAGPGISIDQVNYIAEVARNFNSCI